MLLSAVLVSKKKTAVVDHELPVSFSTRNSTTTELTKNSTEAAAMALGLAIKTRK
jgi:hypothetical protein